ncbi:hypothetical protein CI088_14335 [Enterococcus plantarum]|uniref:DUF1351 domain-containing protein n=1 Tax=Enterococcus plantarum TaxID=1077675 RepID=A0A2W3Z183_9ENTE|nr:DUF1351 domain-containing protein [Enterococcus plantarum]PZL71050.1 hypothetical protein CI088_14335 [Enterococcus plantarum]
MNELTTDIKFNVDFKPSEITIQNEEQLESLVAATITHYSSLVFTDDNIPEAKEAKTKLNSISKLLDDQRKEVKKSYSEPLKAFETKINALRDRIKGVSDEINVGISEYKDQQKQLRSDKLMETLTEMAPNYEVDIAAVEIKPTWLNKGSFTAKGELTKKVLEEIAGIMTLIAKENQRIKEDKVSVFNYAKAVGLDGDGWSSWIDKGRSLVEIMKEIDQAVKDKKAREEQERIAEEQRLAQEEADRKAKEEYEQAMKELRERTVDDKVIDTETGEIIQEDTELTRQEIEDTQTHTLKVTGTHEQLSALNKFMGNEGIRVEVI